MIGDLSGICEDDETDESKNWGRHGNLDLHSWAFDRFTKLLTYKAEMEGITVEPVSEEDTSKSCSCCDRKRDTNRVERGLYVCDECETTANANVNGAENIRQNVSASSPNLSVNKSDGWLAQPYQSKLEYTAGIPAVCEQRVQLHYPRRPPWATHMLPERERHLLIARVYAHLASLLEYRQPTGAWHGI